MTSERKEPGAPDATASEAPPASPSVDPAAPAGEAEEAAAAGSTVARDLDDLLAEVTSERDEYLNLAQRAKADFENYRKRAAREVADAESRGRAALVRELLPSIDNLERALVVAEAGSEVARGVELVHDELRTALGRAGVESYDPTGERFDPTLHEAISTQPEAGGVDPGTVVETLERGYRLDGQVLRPARVVVSE